MPACRHHQRLCGPVDSAFCTLMFAKVPCEHLRVVMSVTVTSHMHVKCEWNCQGLGLGQRGLYYLFSVGLTTVIIINSLSATEAMLMARRRLIANGADLVEDFIKINVRTHAGACLIIKKSALLHDIADRDHCVQYMLAVRLVMGHSSEYANSRDTTLACGRSMIVRPSSKDRAFWEQKLL